MQTGEVKNLGGPFRIGRRRIVRHAIEKMHQREVATGYLYQLGTLGIGEVADRRGMAQHVAGPHRIQGRGQRMTRRDHHAVGLEHVRNPGPARQHRHRQHHQIPAEVDVHDVEIAPMGANPTRQPRSGHPGKPHEWQELLYRKEPQWHTVGLHRRHRIAARTSRQNDIVAGVEQGRALVEGDPGRTSEGTVRRKQRHHLQDAHQPRTMFDGGGTTIELGGTSRVTNAVAATVELAPMVTPRSTVVRAHSHTPSSSTIGALSNSNVGECRSWLPVQT